jgi:DNA mismatch endonuclease, patch repair protein
MLTEMVDIFTTSVRSRIMGRIKGKNTKPELLVRRVLHSLGFRFRLHGCNLPGKPDIVLPRYRKIIFVHGCFWHCHAGCPRATLPKTNANFWRNKINGNLVRDKRIRRELKKLGWDVLVLWQCQLKSTDTIIRRLLRFLS